MRSFGKARDLLVVFLATQLIPIAASIVMAAARPLGRTLDPDGCFFLLSVHHLAQLGFTILLMMLYSRGGLAQWGFNLNGLRASLRIFFWFCLAYLAPVFLVNVLPTLWSGQPPAFGYPLNARNMSGYLGFEFLLSGTCEEPLFRGFVMTILGLSWRKCYRIWKVEISAAGLWATLFFMLAHVGISFRPLAVVNFNAWQQIWAMGLGLYYAIVFHKTRSLLAPVLSHGYSNGIIFVILYLLVFFMK